MKILFNAPCKDLEGSDAKVSKMKTCGQDTTTIFYSISFLCQSTFKTDVGLEAVMLWGLGAG